MDERYILGVSDDLFIIDLLFLSTRVSTKICPHTKTIY